MKLTNFRRILKHYLPAPIRHILMLVVRMIKDISLTPYQRKIVRLYRKNYDHLKLETFTDKSISKTRCFAKEILGDGWNYYSDALRREVVYTFQNSVVQLTS